MYTVMQLENTVTDIQAVMDLINALAHSYEYVPVDNCSYAYFQCQVDLDMFITRLVDIRNTIDDLEYLYSIS